MVKRLISLVVVMMTAVMVFAGGPPGGGQSAEAADETTPQQMQKQADAPQAHQAPVSLPEKIQGKMEKLGRKLEPKQHSVKDGKKAQDIPGNVRTLLIVGLVLVLAGLVLGLISGFGALASACSGVGFILLVVALVIYLVNYA
jgi:hypothetical protein